MVACPVCGTAKDDKEHIKTFFSLFNNEQYMLYHCRRCELEWFEPLKMVPTFYDQEGCEIYKKFHLGVTKRLSEAQQMFFKYMPLKQGKLLDVGCGDGFFLQEAQKAGFQVYGIDIDSKSIEVCRRIRGLKNTFILPPEKFACVCKSEGLYFDVITSFEVLEHQDRPREFLESIKGMLRPGGYLIGSVPDRDAVLARLIYQCFSSIDYPPNHFLRFSKKALKNTLLMVGFNHVEICPVKDNLDTQIWNLVILLRLESVEQKLRGLLLGCPDAYEEAKKVKNVGLLKRTGFKVLKRIKRYALGFPAFVLYAAGLGKSLYFAARKEK